MISTLKKIYLSALLSLLTVPLTGTPAATKTVVVFGDSITAAYGIDAALGYPALLQKKIDDLKWPAKVVAAGLSGDTTAAGQQRLKWVLKQKADILVLALGGNDGLRGVPPQTTQKNLQNMIDIARQTHPEVEIILAGMKMPPNYGPEFTKQFEAIYPVLAKKNKVALVPFLLEGVGGVAQLNLPDRIHPTAEGHKIIAETVWLTLEPVLKHELGLSR